MITKSLANQYKFKPHLVSYLFVTILVLYGIFFWARTSYGMAIFGLPLLFFFPGRFLIEVFPPLKSSDGFFGKFSLSAIYSFCAISVLGIYTQERWGFNTNRQFWVIVLVNFIMFAAYSILPKLKVWKNITASVRKEETYQNTWLDFVPLTLFALAIAAWLIISPLAQNADNFLDILRQSVAQNQNLLLTNRRIFISFLGLTSKFLNLDNIIVYRSVFMILFFVFSLTLYDYLRRNIHSKQLPALLYLTFLAPAVILTEMNNIRPQVMLVVLTVPVLILLVESLKNKKILLSLIALAISAISLLFHELSFILLLTALATVTIHLFRLIFIEKIITWKHVLLSLILIFPYLQKMNLYPLMRPVIGRINGAMGMLSNGQMHWRWWFVNHYVDADGVIVSFTGKNVILYYLYNGFFTLVLLFYTYALLIAKKIKTGVHFFPPTLYFAYFFSSAEIFPRIGLAFLPSRAWIHLMLPAVILLVLIVEINERKKLKIKLLPTILVFSIIIGTGGSLYVAKASIKEIATEEIPASRFIQSNIPHHSLFLSSQENTDLVKVYGNQNNYAKISVKSLINKEEFEQLINSQLKELSKDKKYILQRKIVQTTESYEDNLLMDRKENVLQEERSSTIKAIYSENNPIYFVYSYRKLNAINTANQDRQDSADPINKNTYAQLGYQIVYQDQYVLIIKIR